MSEPSEIVAFWVNEVGPNGWYIKSDKLDADIRLRFLADWEILHDGGYTHWLSSAEDCLAYLILADQFPRNMFRDDKRAFATDHYALSAAKKAVSQEIDLEIKGEARQFFYMPYEHSEYLKDQDQALVLFKERMGSSDEQIIHAKVHREIIRIYGRFPYRNKALGRETSDAEQAFIDENGYQKLLQEMKNNP